MAWNNYFNNLHLAPHSVIFQEIINAKYERDLALKTVTYYNGQPKKYMPLQTKTKINQIYYDVLGWFQRSISETCYLFFQPNNQPSFDSIVTNYLTENKIIQLTGQGIIKLQYNYLSLQSSIYTIEYAENKKKLFDIIYQINSYMYNYPNYSYMKNPIDTVRQYVYSYQKIGYDSVVVRQNQTHAIETNYRNISDNFFWNQATSYDYTKNVYDPQEDIYTYQEIKQTRLLKQARTTISYELNHLADYDFKLWFASNARKNNNIDNIGKNYLYDYNNEENVSGIICTTSGGLPSDIYGYYQDNFEKLFPNDTFGNDFHLIQSFSVIDEDKENKKAIQYYLTQFQYFENGDTDETKNQFIGQIVPTLDPRILGKYPGTGGPDEIASQNAIRKSNIQGSRYSNQSTNTNVNNYGYVAFFNFKNYFTYVDQ